MTATALLRIGALVFVATTMIVLGDTAGKLLTSQGVSPVIVAWSRFAIAAIVLLPFSGFVRAEVSGFLNRWIWIRAASIAAGICLILTALKTEPIANVFGAFFVGPIVSYILALIFLKEPVSAVRTGLLAVGFAGVMLVVKPGFGATVGIGFALMAGVCYGAYLTLTKHVADQFRPRFLLLSQLVIGTLLLTPLGLRAEMPLLTGEVAGLLIASALCSAAGNLMFVLASRKAPASLIAPLVYGQLIAATVLGVLVFGDWPDAIALLGLAVIFASGVGTLWAFRRAG